MTQPADQLVVTDRDFGRAYLTDAWAARFVHDMLRHYCVLFVGYSHNDRVMTYLARGLNLSCRHRYAMVQGSANPRFWSGLSITPVTYTKRRGNNPHLSLTEGIEAWASQARMGLLDHAGGSKSLSAGPPTEPVEQSYFTSVIGDEQKAVLFQKHATGPEWMRWLAQQPAASGLFQLHGDLTLAQRVLAVWFAQQAVHHPEEALQVLREVNSLVHPNLWHELARSVWQAQKDGKDVIVAWVPSCS